MQRIHLLLTALMGGTLCAGIGPLVAANREEPAEQPASVVIQAAKDRTRGIYIEGGQERFGRIGAKDYLMAAVHRAAAGLDRPVRPLIWADEFTMYGPGKDGVGIERIPRDTVMGFWKYWSDYTGINGLLERGYDVLGISAMYNHTFYLLVDTQVALFDAADQPHERVREILAGLPQRWSAQRERMQHIFEQSQQLYTRGDPLGLAALLTDIASIESHLQKLADDEECGSPVQRHVVLDERFERLDDTRWMVLGTPRIVNGRLETRAPGGWEHYSGIATRQELELHETRPLVIEFSLTPLEMGIDSQLLASANEQGTVSFRFSFYGPGTRFGVYTQSSVPLNGPWENVEPGWKPRAHSPVIEAKATYRVRAELTRRAWRVAVWPSEAQALQPPLWDTGHVPMDELARTRLVFADVEPPAHTAASRWGPLTIWRAP